MSQPVIVVGLDSTPAGRGALSYALERATALNGRLRLVRAVPTPGPRTPGLESTSVSESQTTGHPDFDWVSTILAASNTEVPRVIETIAGSPVDVLTAASQTAAALVVGTPDGPDAVLTDAILVSLRRNSRCLLIEVSASGGVARASGPVAASTVPVTEPGMSPLPTPQAGDTIMLVGFDGSAGSDDALDWALQHARTFGSAVEVIAAYRLGAGESATDARAGAERKLSSGLRRIEQYRDVTVSSQTVLGEPVDVLTRASGHAEMLVLGRHGTTGMLHSAMGSVGDGCSRLADCPVTIVPSARRVAHDGTELVSRSYGGPSDE